MIGRKLSPISRRTSTGRGHAAGVGSGVGLSRRRRSVVFDAIPSACGSGADQFRIGGAQSALKTVTWMTGMRESGSFPFFTDGRATSDVTGDLFVSGEIVRAS